LFRIKRKDAESKADTQQHLHKRSAEAVVAGQTPMGAHFPHFLRFPLQMKAFPHFNLGFPSLF
jgi:hypothetical protein